MVNVNSFVQQAECAEPVVQEKTPASTKTNSLVYHYRYLIGINPFIHRPSGHEEVDGSRGQLGRKFVEFAELLHVVYNRVVLCCIFLCLLKYGGDLTEDQ